MGTLSDAGIEAFRTIRTKTRGHLVATRPSHVTPAFIDLNVTEILINA